MADTGPTGEVLAVLVIDLHDAEHPTVTARTCAHAACRAAAQLLSPPAPTRTPRPAPIGGTPDKWARWD